MEEGTEMGKEFYIQTWSKSNKISFEEKAEIYGYSPMSKKFQLIIILMVLVVKK